MEQLRRNRSRAPFKKPMELQLTKAEQDLCVRLSTQRVLNVPLR